jgi:hypothetical protein
VMGTGSGSNGVPDPGGNNGDNPVLTALQGQCLARAHLTQLKQLASPAVFRKITWENGMKLVKLNPSVQPT